MNKLKHLLITTCICTSLIGTSLLYSVKASNISLYPNINSSSYNQNNIFTLCGYKGQCTWFTYGRTLEKLNLKLPKNFYGNAVTWWYQNINNKTYPYGNEAKANSIAVWSGGNLGYGHVAFVEKVENNLIYFNEGNFSVRGDYDKNIKLLSKEAIKNRGNLYLKGYIYLENNSDTINSSEDALLKYGTVNISCNSSLNVRTNPSITSNVCGSLKKGNKIIILDKIYDFYKIKFNSTFAFVHSKYINITSNNVNNNTSTSNKFATVILKDKSSKLNVRNIPSQNGKILSCIAYGAKVEILQTLNGWYKIKAANLIGYVSIPYIKLS
ncbi:SH3 domain-containing protein [Clostridium rectalis]|uniref:SH3 domain-containing protein n=1 Tax=Clostridium rectalis TaxID=2040295 RepID=UPI0013DDF3AC|nr:SH3 domain-containing protein [Clostridium rectalis]